MVVDTNVYIGAKKVLKPVVVTAKEKKLSELVTSAAQPRATLHADRLVRTGENIQTILY